MKIVVSAQTKTWQTRPADPDDRWDAGNTRGCVSDVNAWVARDWETDTGYGGYDSWSGDLDVLPGDYIYAVVADYESGSTFGRDGGHVSLLDVFVDIRTADSLAQVAEAATEYGFWFGDREYYAAWMGYFEQLQDMRVWAIKVESR